jgi:hypothetical protein
VTIRLGGTSVRRTLAEWVLPPGVKRALVRVASARKSRLSRTERVALASNSRVQGAFAGRRCFVLANGPSLANVDIDSFGSEVTVVMNAFNRHPALRLWQPTVHCVAEPADTYTTPEGIEFLQGLLTGYTSTIHVFPLETKAMFDETGLLPPERLVLFKADGRPASEFDRVDLTRPIPSPHDTSVLAVSVAIAMGCDPIVILGLDQNGLSHQGINRHFYDDATVPWPVEDLGLTPYLVKMRQGITTFEAHAALGRIAAKNGQTIFNATEGSFLDVYPRATLADLLAPKD